MRVHHRHGEELHELSANASSNHAALCTFHWLVYSRVALWLCVSSLPPGVYLTTLTFINDGAGDRLGDNMINFRKRQKAAEVIQDIKRWQSKPYNFQTVASILSYLEECFNKYSDGHDYADQFWNISLEREPREREDEKMARLLQESGFL